MRKDAEGFLWTTPPPHKAVKPEPTWLSRDYLPGLEEARRFPVDLMTDWELQAEAGGTLVVDCEVYPNYFLVAFRSEKSNKVTYLESPNLDLLKLKWILNNFLLVSFNGINFDLPILALACAGCTTKQLKQATEMIITCGERPAQVLRHFKVPALKVNHIDLIEVCPLEGSLKLYAARLHCKRMQDLPFHPNSVLTEDQITIIRYYCCNDLENTSLIYRALAPDLDLRMQLSTDYKMDLRSKSDAQIAEAVISAEVTQRNGIKPKRPDVEVHKKHFYKVPAFIGYRTQLLQYVLNTVATTPFVVGENGGIKLPEAISNLDITINGLRYQMGIGGLHSTESSVYHTSDSEYVLLDRDVASYYPAIIINQGLYPKHMGLSFGTVYRSLRDRRLAAKKAKQTRIAGSLKITINGGFGKLGSRWSMLYSPELLIQVTITGQLSLLMLIEDIELAGIRVVSANTDGIVIKCPRARESELGEIIHLWEQRTSFETEETRYLGLFSRDVNNYIAIKEDRKTKGKGVFANPWKSGDFTTQMQKNPHSVVCVEAVTDFLANGIPMEQTILQCRDFTKFCTVQNVKGGAVKSYGKTTKQIPKHSSKHELLSLHGYFQYGNDNNWRKPDWPELGGMDTDLLYSSVIASYTTPSRMEYLGKTIRWYYAKGVDGVIIYAKNGNKVPRSEGAKPAMQLPEVFPDDVDFDWYVTEAREMLKGLGYGI